MFSIALEKYGWGIMGVLILIFIFSHLPGLDLPYHQDEYKWAEYVNPELYSAGGIPHPPIGEFVYHHVGSVVGYDNLRIVPLLFGAANLLLLYVLSSIIFNRRAAIYSAGLFVISFYSLLASSMVDTDGALMPFFLLLSCIFYYKWKDGEYLITSKWFPLLFGSLVLGVLTKESFVLLVFALVVDFAVSNKVFADAKRFSRYLLFGIVTGGMSLVGILLLSKYVFPFFDFQYFLSFLPRFLNFEDRGWMQTFIQFSKALMYLSPLLIIPMLFISKEVVRRGRPLIFFILTGLVFYLFAFDFSVGALDRYFQFLIIPLCVFAGVVIAQTVERTEGINSKVIAFAFVAFLFIFGAQFLNHEVLSLYPKSEWLTRVLGFKWNFLFPFTGGSGPSGFYVSFLFISLVWLASILLGLLAFIKPYLRKTAFAGIVIIGLAYNLVFIEEYLVGNINGSNQVVLEQTRSYVVANSLDKIVVYNDIGGYEYRRMGIYERRLYAAPGFEAGYREFFENFVGHVVYIDIPKVEEGSFYSNYLNSCERLFESKDGYITGIVLRCGD